MCLQSEFQYSLIECASDVDTPKLCKLTLVYCYTVNLCAPAVNDTKLGQLLRFEHDTADGVQNKLAWTGSWSNLEENTFIMDA